MDCRNCIECGTWLSPQDDNQKRKDGGNGVHYSPLADTALQAMT
jgi:hypothetical protein